MTSHATMRKHWKVGIDVRDWFSRSRHLLAFLSARSSSLKSALIRNLPVENFFAQESLWLLVLHLFAYLVNLWLYLGSKQ